MTTILILAAIFCLYQIAKGISDRHKEAERQEAEYRREHDAATLRQEWREMQEKAKQDVLTRQAEFREQERQRKLAELDREALWKEQDRLWKEQERQAKEQTRLAKEQDRQAAQLAKHEDRLAKMEYESKQARRDIDHLKDRLAQQYAMMDSLLLRQSKTEPGTKAFDALQKQIIVLDNQMHQTRKQYSKAAFVVNDNLRKSKRESA